MKPPISQGDGRSQENNLPISLHKTSILGISD